MDLTLVWLLGFVPVWLLGVVDYHGSRLVALEPLRWPSASAVVRVLEKAVAAEGAPARVLTDRGSVFRSEAFRAALEQHKVKHTLTKPHHPWTNGRIERLFRTFNFASLRRTSLYSGQQAGLRTVRFKETVREHFWLVRSRREWAMICADFRVFHNEHRPHQSYGGVTPAEVHAGRSEPPHGAIPVTFFGGRMRWWRFS
jgi:transposase InsO family protein